MQPKARTKQSKVALAAAGIDMAAKGLALISPPAALALYGTGKLLGAVSPILDLRRVRLESEFQRIFEIASEESAADEAFYAWAKAQAEDEAAQDRIFELARNYIGRACVDVLPAVSMLFREYHRASKPADAYYRNLMAFLCELDSEEFDCIRQLIEMIDDSIVEPRTGPLELQFRSTVVRGSSLERPVYQFEAQPIQGVSTKYPPPIQSPSMRRIFRLLATHELALGQDVGMRHEVPLIGMSRDEIARLRQIVAPHTRR